MPASFDLITVLSQFILVKGAKEVKARIVICPGPFSCEPLLLHPGSRNRRIKVIVSQDGAVVSVEFLLIPQAEMHQVNTQQVPGFGKGDQDGPLGPRIELPIIKPIE